jgi:signal transduction histidine kinase
MIAAQPSILVVDDEPDVVTSVRDLLRLDYQVFTAIRPGDAVSILDRQKIAVVLTDQRMPGMTGVELLHRVRETHPDTIRLLFTGYADIGAVIDAINKGSVYRYITKPWDPDELHALVRDAVERHALIAERQRLFAELERKHEELRLANADLAQLSALKSNFINVASHELRTPLVVLVTRSALATEEPGVQQPLRSWLQNMWTATDRLRHVVEQLTAMLLLENFERPLERRPESLAALLDSVADDVAPFIALRRQLLVRDYDDGLGTIEVEASKIRDSVTHLLLNAIKFTPDAGRMVLHAARTADGGAEIHVSDTGNGIDPASLRRIFDPFFTQLDVTRHSSGTFEHERRGLGLGLSLVKAFVEMHGGRVDVESEVGRGSTFRVTLPGVAGEPRAARPSQEAHA